MQTDDEIGQVGKNAIPVVCARFHVVISAPSPTTLSLACVVELLVRDLVKGSLAQAEATGARVLKPEHLCVVVQPSPFAPVIFLGKVPLKIQRCLISSFKLSKVWPRKRRR